MKKTALHASHIELGAKMVPFGDWEMPVQYEGILKEHMAVRERTGLFDVSHMGRISISGKDTVPFLNYLSTNEIAVKAPGTAIYTVWCQEGGGCVDDLIVYLQSAEQAFVVANASNREKDLQHLQKYAQDFAVMIQDRFQDGILALQGPLAASLLDGIFPLASLKPMHFAETRFQGQPLTISHTGYTGESGCELFADEATIVALWQQLLAKGAVPVGLGARDTLRLEMGYALYGHEISEAINPLESVCAWTVKLRKERFLGKQAIEQKSTLRSEAGLLLQERGVPRQGYEVHVDGQQIGVLTSGTHSPCLNQGIAIGLVDRPLQQGTQVEILIRDKKCSALVTALPFYKRKRT